MWWFAPEQQRWILQPLIDAGLPAADISLLLNRLAGDVDSAPDVLAADQPAPIRAALTHTIERMLTLPGPDRPEPPPSPRLPAPRSHT